MNRFFFISLIIFMLLAFLLVGNTYVKVLRFPGGSICSEESMIICLPVVSTLIISLLVSLSLGFIKRSRNVTPVKHNSLKYNLLIVVLVVLALQLLFWLIMI